VVCTDAVSGLLFLAVLFSGDPMHACLFSNASLAVRPLSHPALAPDVPWRSPGSGCSHHHHHHHHHHHFFTSPTIFSGILLTLQKS
jgi:hypothetical protein